MEKIWFVALLACSSSYSGGEGDREDAEVTRDAGASDARTEDMRADAGTQAPPDADPTPDAADPCSAPIFGEAAPPDPVYVTPEQADCLHITSPACTSCHVGDDGRFALRLAGAPPMPEGVDLISPEACGVRPNVVCADVAACLGLDDPQCIGCHVARGEYVRAPWWETEGAIPPFELPPDDCFSR